MDFGVASTQELVDAAAAIAAELATRPAPESAAVCMELAETLAAASDAHEAALAGFVARVDAASETRRWGLPSTQAWLRSRLGMRDTRAKERVTLARQLHRLPVVTELLARGELSCGYASTVADAVARLDDDDCAKAETLLLDMIGQGFSPGKVAAFGRRIREVIAERDGCEEPPEEVQRGYERSWIDSTRSLDGGRYIKGWLNAEDAAVWDGTLGPLAKPAGPDDHRDLAERTAAALSSVLAGGHKATKVTVVCDLDTLTGGHAPARLTDGTPIPAPQARRIALAAGVSPLLLRNGNAPLYLGHKVRFATAAQRQVLESLYSTCAVRGCEVPGTLCEVDHVNGWALGDSPTDIDKLALCCGWHNRYKHTHPQHIHTTHDPATGRYTYRLHPPGTPTTHPPTTNPRTAHPPTTNPRTAEPRTAQPRTAQPRTAQPRTAQPRTAQPRTAQPRTAQPRTAEPRTAEPWEVEPWEVEPWEVEPWEVESWTAEPWTAEPWTAEPWTAEPRPSERRTTEPRTVEPRTVEPRPSERRVAEPRTVELRATAPRATAPRATDPRTVDPRTAEPRTVEPRAAEPRPSEPRPSELRTTEPSTTIHWAA
ncbi:HNH endonuclease signature motif containing protein [Actinomadura sp. K4S16]|uniref:HNH endonuclease signature motif containing protein n=1 Tax=Actinomadura sp. K4S16 TaxID=1316147 RepID=UPI00135CBDE0|nr:HNH endonuclease signature motif containing protein [Actinomadura sp. K4S16]